MNTPKKTEETPIYERNIVLITSILNYAKKIGFQVNTIKTFFKFLTTLDTSLFYPPFIEIEEARKSFDFPIGHPIDGTIYASSEIEPKKYLPLSIFHSNMYKSKLSYFMDMCSFLGVKECTLTEITTKGKTYKINGELKTDIDGNKLESDTKASLDKNSLIKMRGHFSFPKPIHKIKKLDSKWLVTEETWRKMQEIRIERDISTYEVEFNINNDFGINLNSVNKFGGNGISFGGDFKEFNTATYIYKIEFWEK